MEWRKTEDLRKMSELLKNIKCQIRMESRIWPCLPEEEEASGKVPEYAYDKYVIGLRFKQHKAAAPLGNGLGNNPNNTINNTGCYFFFVRQ